VCACACGYGDAQASLGDEAAIGNVLVEEDGVPVATNAQVSKGACVSMRQHAFLPQDRAEALVAREQVGLGRRQPQS